MKIATFNVNGVNGRLPVLLRWLAEAEPDVLCLQELKAAQEKFPEAAIREAGCQQRPSEAVWPPSIVRSTRSTPACHIRFGRSADNSQYA
jgi:exonuclease III